MNKEIISQKQAISLVVTFIYCSTLVMGSGSEAGRDAWLADLLGSLLAVPLYFIYARLLSIFPGLGLFEVAEKVFGKIGSYFIILPYVWYGFHLGAIALRNFTEFIKILTMPETPQYAIGSLMIIVCIWATRAGLEVIGRWVCIILPVIITAIIVVSLLAVPLYKPEHLLPILNNNWGTIADGAFTTFSFPMAEVILFTILLGNMRQGSSPKKVLFMSLLIGCAVVTWVGLRSVMTLGEANIQSLYYASYSTVGLINVGDFIQRIEVSVSVVFIFSGFIKICICLYTTSCGLTRMFKLKEERTLTAPLGVLMMVFSLFLFSDTMEMFIWASKIYKFYALPFQVIIPIILWISAEIKSRRLKAT